MIEVVYRREVPFSRTRVLSQYFDLEHLEHVHPRSFGQARMVSQVGRLIVWELEWPRVLGVRGLRSVFHQQYVPPWGIRAVITRGLLRGTETEVRLEETHSGTLVEESHRIAMPGWKGLRPLVQRAWIRRLDRIWDEDLRVGVCHGGWPGVPLLESRLP